MATDFRAGQVETSKLIASGGIANGKNIGIAIYSGSNASNRAGGISDTAIFDNVGTDVFLFVSGTATKTGTSRSNITLFGGNIVVSGTIWAERQIIEVDEVIDGDLIVTGNFLVEPDVDSTTSVQFRQADGSMIFNVDSSNKRIGIGDATPDALLDIQGEAGSAVPTLKVVHLDGDVIGIDIDSNNTSGIVMDMFSSTLTSGKMLHINENSSNTSTRNIVEIKQNHADAIAATALKVQSDGGITGVTIDKNFTDVAAATVTGLHVDFDRTVPGSGTATFTDIGIDLDVNAAGLGTTTTTGLDIDVVGATSGDHTATGLTVDVSAADTNIGIVINCADGGTDIKAVSSADAADYFSISVGAAGATTITTTEDGGGSSANLTMTIDGAVDIQAVNAVTIDSSASTISVGGDSVAQKITIGGDTSTRTEVELNAIVVDINGGATGVTIDTLDAGSIDIGTSAAGASDTSAINIGTSATARTITIGNDASTKVDINALEIELDSAGDITLDAAGNDIIISSAGTDIAHIQNSSSDLIISASLPNKRIIFKTQPTVGSSNDYLSLGQGSVIVNSSAEDIDFRVGTVAMASAILVDATEGVVIAGNKTTFTALPEVGVDTLIVLSGTVGSRGGSTRGTTLIAGDLVISGTAYDSTGTEIGGGTLDDSYDKGGTGAGAIITVDGQPVQIVTAGSNKIGFVVTGSVLIGSGADGSLPALASDTNFYVSGTIGGKNNQGTSVFGGDVAISGSVNLEAGQSINLGSTLEMLLSDGTDFDITSGRKLKFDFGSKADANFSFSALGTNLLIITASKGNAVLSSSVDNNDIIFHGNDATEVVRIDGSEKSLLVAGTQKIEFEDTNKWIRSDGTDLSIVSQTDVNIVAISDTLVDVDGDIILDARQATIFKDGGNSFLRASRSTNGDGILSSSAPAQDIVFHGDASGERLRIIGPVGAVLVLSGGGGTSPNYARGLDVNFYVSGSIGSKGTTTMGTSVFGGDVVISGSLTMGKQTIVQRLYWNGGITNDTYRFPAGPQGVNTTTSPDVENFWVAMGSGSLRALDIWASEGSGAQCTVGLFVNDLGLASCHITGSFVNNDILGGGNRGHLFIDFKDSKNIASYITGSNAFNPGDLISIGICKTGGGTWTNTMGTLYYEVDTIAPHTNQTGGVPS